MMALSQPRSGLAEGLATLAPSALVNLARAGDQAAVRYIVQMHNRRLYRAARAILQDDLEAEDVVQEAYVRAFSALDSFRGESGLGTWLTRIAVNEALGRRRRQREQVTLEVLDDPQERDRAQVITFPQINPDIDPEKTTARHEIRRLLERAIDDLPETFRIVLVLRDVEELTVEETAKQLKLRPQTVRSRLHRARMQLRKSLDSEISSTLTDVFPFAGARCVRIVETVLSRLSGPHEVEQ